MNIVTIIDENWLNTHLVRFVNLAAKAMPKEQYGSYNGAVIPMNDYYMIVVYSDKAKLAEIKKLPIISFFKKVSYVLKDQEAPGYMQYNALRFSLLKRFKLDECLYSDADVDVFADLSPIAKESDASLLWMRSPCEVNGFGPLLQLLGLNGEHTDKNPHSNAGMLYIRKDYAKKYEAACERVAATDANPRMIGNAAFNVMLRSMDPKLHAKVPYKYDVIWWDYEKWPEALAIHYCNDEGKKERERREALWVR